jgi:hypothetical protein
MLPFKLVYHDRYDLNLGSHVFPSRKYRLIRDRLLQEHFAEPGDFSEPESACDADILRATRCASALASTSAADSIMPFQATAKDFAR